LSEPAALRPLNTTWTRPRASRLPRHSWCRGASGGRGPAAGLPPCVSWLSVTASKSWIPRASPPWRAFRNGRSGSES